jgi:hypothetical protein
LAICDKRGVAKAAEVEVNNKLGDAGQPQQARRKGKERSKDEERETWIALDMVRSSFHIYIYSRIFLAFNSILRILRRHSSACRSGWDIVAKYSRLFRYPESYHTRPHELLVLPFSFVGLVHESFDNSTKFSRFGDNTYCRLQRRLNGKGNISLSSRFGMLFSVMFSYHTYFIHQCQIPTLRHPATVSGAII